MSLFAEQDDFALSTGLSEDEIMNLALQRSLEIEDERKKQVELSRRALMLQQDEEYRQSLIKDMEKDIDICTPEDDYDFDYEEEKEENENVKEEEIHDKEEKEEPKEGDYEALRNARCRYFQKFK